jgi:Do/DeqQ family serine protease
VKRPFYYQPARSRGNLSAFLIFLFLLCLAVGGAAFWRLTRPASTSSAQIFRIPKADREFADREPLATDRSLETIDREFTDLVDHVVPSVVSINTVTAPDREALLRQFFGLTQGPVRPLTQVGSGMIVSTAGHIVTNWHVIKGASQVSVQLCDGRTLPATLVGADPGSDIAVLKIDDAGLVPIEFGNSDKVRVGQMVFAVGNPFGLQETVTQGIISAKGRRTTSEAEFFQTSTTINPGNSGGPLIDIHGKVIGINNFIISRSGGSEGIGFAIPSNVAKKTYEQIIEKGRVSHPWLGVFTRPLNQRLALQLGLPDTNGALVAATTAGSPAERAGLCGGDVITSFNGQPIHDDKDLRSRVAGTEIGSPVALGVLRGGKLLEVGVTLEEAPEG